MKKIKLLAPILSASVLATTIVPIVSCNKNNNHGAAHFNDISDELLNQSVDSCYALYYFEFKSTPELTDVIEVEASDLSITDGYELELEASRSYTYYDTLFVTAKVSSKNNSPVSRVIDASFNMNIKCYDALTGKDKWVDTITGFNLMAIDTIYNITVKGDGGIDIAYPIHDKVHEYDDINVLHRVKTDYRLSHDRSYIKVGDDYLYEGYGYTIGDTLITIDPIYVAALGGDIEVNLVTDKLGESFKEVTSCETHSEYNTVLKVNFEKQPTDIKNLSISDLIVDGRSYPLAYLDESNDDYTLTINTLAPIRANVNSVSFTIRYQDSEGTYYYQDISWTNTVRGFAFGNENSISTQVLESGQTKVTITFETNHDYVWNFKVISAKLDGTEYKVVDNTTELSDKTIQFNVEKSTNISDVSTFEIKVQYKMADGLGWVYTQTFDNSSKETISETTFGTIVAEQIEFEKNRDTKLVFNSITPTSGKSIVTDEKEYKPIIDKVYINGELYPAAELISLDVANKTMVIRPIRHLNYIASISFTIHYYEKDSSNNYYPCRQDISWSILDN